MEFLKLMVTERIQCIQGESILTLRQMKIVGYDLSGGQRLNLKTPEPGKRSRLVEFLKQLVRKHLNHGIIRPKKIGK